MITISNLGPTDQPDPNEWHEYEVRINRELIAMCQHRRSDGLVECLRRAANAVAASNAGQLGSVGRGDQGVD